MARLTSYRRGELTFDVVDAGPEDGDVVVLLHGFPQSAREWDGVTAILNASGYRTIAPNQRGYSPGARPRGRRAYRMSEVAADAAQLVETIGRGPVHMVGHDYGAAIGWLLAAGQPQLVRTLTALSVPHPAAFRRALLTSRQFLASWYMAAFQLPYLPERYLDPSTPAGRRRFVQSLVRGGQSEAAAERDAAFMSDSGTLTAAMNWYRAIPLSNPRIPKTVKVPTLLIWSDGDNAVLGKGGELSAGYVSSRYRYEVLNGVSHWIPDEVPELTAKLILEHIA